MYYSGFADEAARDIAGQIAVTRRLGWTAIEARRLNGRNITEIDEAEFDAVEAALAAAGVTINCFGSEVANWNSDPFKETDFERSLAMLRRAAVRMKRLGTRLLRGMSFAMQKTRDPFDPAVERQVFAKVRKLVDFCEAHDLVYLHENCMNYGGQSHEHALKLFDAIDSPHFQLLFDTGNPVFTPRRLGSPPYPRQSSWEFYTGIRDFIGYVHIKDCRFVADTDGLFPVAEFTFPGEGDGEIERIVADLLARGYDGCFSIEPHLAGVFHQTADGRNNDEAAALYVAYGKKLMELIDRVKS
ncbi:sugar phosphate isomerase/epimerase [Victivallis sp. Marseille-Q1083]|uniref:sugar phosphate isomerase/epimerase family protein n=1 Tax=Victivallis sp. Marseille-Q1083 TaxID=2717288 RepID=UPI00158DA8CE|nr:sugar phosphate isomerase/epimerase family protein [Victivallis sp. Marseille-Q1083]